MPHHAEQRLVPYRPDQIFDLVADIERYPEFLPWCVGARVRSRNGNLVTADLVIGFKMFRESFTSEVVLDRPSSIDVTYTEGPLSHLHNHWKFAPAGEDACYVAFDVDFEFRSRVLRAVVSPLFHEAVRRMVRAFESRARVLYGPPSEAGVRSA